MIPNIRLYLELGAAAVLVIAFMVFRHHEQQIGAANLQHSVDAATAQAVRNAAAQTAALQAKSDSAAMEATHAQARLDDYVHNYPLQPVRVCSPARSSASLPQAGAASGVAGSASPGPDSGSDVPAGSAQAGPDIAPEFDTIVRAFGSVAIDLREFQAR